MATNQSNDKNIPAPSSLSSTMVFGEREFIMTKLNIPKTKVSNKDAYIDLVKIINEFCEARQSGVTTSALQSICYITPKQMEESNGSRNFQAATWDYIDAIYAYILQDPDATRKDAIKAHIDIFEEWYPNDLEVKEIKRKMSEATAPVLPDVTQKDRKRLLIMTILAALGVIIVTILTVHTCRTTQQAPKSITPSELGIAFRTIKGDTFKMGNVLNDKVYDDEEVHEVIVSTFDMSDTEITYSQFDAFCKATGRHLKDRLDGTENDHPVIFVSWYEAVEFCNWYSELDDKTPVYTLSDPNPQTGHRDLVGVNINANGYRLPTEAEWEFAAICKADSNIRFRFGNAKNIAKYDEMNYDATDMVVQTYAQFYADTLGKRLRNKPLGVRNSGFTANQNDLYGMAGNVQEWCHDIYNDKVSDIKLNPAGAEQDKGYYGKSNYRVVKGGSWNSPPLKCRAAFREAYHPHSADDETGFRIVRRDALH